MKLRTKILAGYGVALTLVILVCGWGIINIRRLGRASEAILRENYRSILAAENMIDAIERQDSATLLVLLGNEEQGTEQFSANEVLFLQWLGRAKDNITIPGEKEVLLNLEKNYKDYLLTFSQLRRQQLRQTPVSTDYYYDTLLPAFESVRQTSVELRELNQKTMVLASQRTQALSHQAIGSMAVTGGAAAGLGLGFSLLLSTRLVRPLKEMTRATERIAEGDYDIAITVKSDDELGLLAQEITTMSQNLKVFHELNVGQVIAEKQRSESIIRSISDGLVVVDAEFEIIAINPIAAAILNTTAEQAKGKHFLSVFNHQQLYEYLNITAQTGTPPQLNENQSILSKQTENQAQYYKFAITPVTTEEGTMLGVVLLLQDVTKLKELDTLKSEFVATASHELRTPLTGMAMSLNLLLETAQQKLSNREQELLHAAVEDVERLRTLVNDLLDLSKIESGRIELEFIAVEVELLIEKAISILSVQAQEKQIELTPSIPTDIEPVKADPNKIIWVLINLIANALRYTEAGGHIQVSAQQKDDWVYLSVADNGLGIPWEYQAKIFDKFVQVKTDKDVGGSGLGLAICKEIVKAHSGTIWVDSAPGEGSTFTFTLPVVNER
ncbi:HAMP domain-containing sensor histidine kinase [Allocoleopsis franciscana]|uniref:histidine kinase n=1 Tax=Allocoleopsis franciscana PCC 7113 TaxID=1173027 RepID=K9WNZ9_9CYAN|nr:ATP-binding protein [Allocoleopsis franciscana]AFZ21531.1 PAS domain S-box [Allocoleopsis franciscana PCC 7113]